MWEFISECFDLVNLPFTVLLLIIMSYWVMVVIGVLGMEALDFDFDADINPDLDVDADLDGDFDADINGETSFSTATLKFFHFGELPVMVIASVFFMCMWATSVAANHYINHELSWLVALWLLGPNIIISLIVSKLILIPMVPMFRFMSAGEAARIEIVGKTCLITTDEVSETFGVAEISQDGPPIVINVRTAKGDYVTKGDAALVYEYDASEDVYKVRPVKPEKQ